MQHTHAVTRDETPEEAGFTLIELMTVVLIIAILIIVLIPTFVGAKKRAQDRATQAGLRNGLIAAKVIYSDHGDYTEATVAGLSSVEPSLTFLDAASSPSAPNALSVDPATKTYIVMGSQSKSGTCFFVSDDASAPTGTGVLYAKSAGGGCAAASAPAPGDAAWGSTW
jgi:type IV pilus assembly protein PilA